MSTEATEKPATKAPTTGVSADDLTKYKVIESAEKELPILLHIRLESKQTYDWWRSRTMLSDEGRWRNR